MSLASARAPLPDLIEESFEEAAFLWLRWEAELTSLTRNLDEVWNWTEDRLQGALAGVRLADDGLVEFCKPHLICDDLSRVAAATAVLAASDSASVVQMVVDTMTRAEGPRLMAIARGLEVAGSNQVLSAAAGALQNLSTTHHAALCSIKAARSARPGPELASAFQSEDPQLQICALRAARFMAEDHPGHWLQAGLHSEHPEVRLTAIETGSIRGLAGAWQAAIDAVGTADARLAPVLRLIALLGTADDHALIHSALRMPSLQIHALWALGHVGTRQSVEVCLQGMKHEKLARAAAEAYCHITGADLERDHLAVAVAAGEVPAFEADDLDADLVPTPESLWPMPDVEAVQRHWKTHEADFQPGIRYIRGRAATLETLLGAIETGPMLRRPDLILNLAARSRGAYDVQPRAFAARQRIMMSRGRTALAAAGA